MQDGHAACLFRLHGYAGWKCSMDKRQEHATRTSSMDMSMGLQRRHPAMKKATTCSMDTK
jgi:hypothetical protein